MTGKVTEGRAIVLGPRLWIVEILVGLRPEGLLDEIEITSPIYRIRSYMDIIGRFF